MALPIILFGLLIAILLGVLFHLLRGGGGMRLLLYIALSILGFALGQWISLYSGLNLNIYKFGALDIGMCAIGSILIMAIGDWLSRIEPKNKSGV